MEFVGALKRPFADVKAWVIGCVILLLGAVFVFIPVLGQIVAIVATLFVLGYVGDIGKLTLKKKMTMPAWANLGNTFVQGLMLLVLAFIFMVPAMIVLFVGGVSAVLGLLASGLGGDSASMVGLGAAGAGFGVAAIIGMLLWITAAYLIPVAWLAYLSKGKFGDAFHFAELFKKAFTGAYLGAWVVTILVWVVYNSVGAIIPFVGTAVAGFTAMVTNMTLLAVAYRKA